MCFSFRVRKVLENRGMADEERVRNHSHFISICVYVMFRKC